MQILPAGGNAPIKQNNITVTITAAGAAVDISAFRLYKNGKVHGDSDMIFYNQLESDDGAISLQHIDNTAVFSINLSKVRPDVTTIAFTLTCNNSETIAVLSAISATVDYNNAPQLQGRVQTSGRAEAALIVCEVYRHKGIWKFRFVSQGFNGGLKALAEYFGIEVTDTTSRPPQPSIPPIQTAQAVPPTQPTLSIAPTGSASSTIGTVSPISSVNTSKVTLTKEQPSISLTKQKATSIGKIRINLDWNKGQLRQGFFSSERTIDLDLGAFIRFQDGERDVVQALGRRFGCFEQAPWVILRGDDRTGASTSGEWLEINGNFWDKLQEILIYTFIYEGASNWGQTDAVTTIYVPHHPPVETHLIGGDERKTLCAIARLVNSKNGVTIERLNEYFKNQEDLDFAYNWGFSWRVGRK